ncbi:hypothetical protein [Mucilaginibacter segetis]|uniref:Glycosyl transferase n=1 Tax=Mucilaginibacter segetis TaxID=2793071 RepID=A0A934PRQ2_9SPHI|nr:hypothetical protein [Mucilaginibacter segetis]MBK0378195.1 hypothetical protein [Mucilaginibacter segetis]
MKKKSLELPPVISENDGLPIYFLTGKNYLYQTLFCIQSLTKVTTMSFKYILVDDGSFDNKLIGQIQKQLPGAEIISNDIIQSNIEKAISIDKYPYLRKKRAIYPHIKKLTDIHTIPDNKWKLVLDSDMLFWSEPITIIKWLQNPYMPIHMVDCEESYGYSRNLMKELSGAEVKPMLNVGVIGLNSDQVNWDGLEFWIKNLEEKEKTSYYLEQALTAMLIGNQHTNALNPDEYIVNPSFHLNKNKIGVLHHYVDTSKESYYTKSWKVLIK